MSRIPIRDAAVIIDGKCYPVVEPPRPETLDDGSVVIYFVDNEKAYEMVASILASYNTLDSPHALRVRDMPHAIRRMFGVEISQYRITKLVNEMRRNKYIVPRERRILVHPDAATRIRYEIGAVPILPHEELRREKGEPIIRYDGVIEEYAVRRSECLD